jgi:hypothetical protein
MAEYCLKCFNKMNNTDYSKRDVILSKDEDICEGCGSWVPVVIRLALGFWFFRW